ncbi:MAG TPA: 6-phosphogluconolactonase [Vicinamibacteria bacterium]|nr:6-phosphogluconolactonase [Vicinamibacteria bacterium]
MPRVILGFDDAEAVAQYAAREFVRRARSAIEASGAFKVALAGGSTPRRTHELLADPSLSNQVDWEATHIFFGDERAAPPDHPDSNYGNALETLLSRVKIPEAQIHRMEGERADLDTAATEYEATLAESFDLTVESGLPRFDLVMLGLGEDGHTASLFPGTLALDESRAWVVANDVPEKATRRLTMTVPLLNAARCVMFTVEGGDKAASLSAVLEGPSDPHRFPAQLIAAADGDLLWLIDRAAAANLTLKPEDPSPSRSRS